MYHCGTININTIVILLTIDFFCTACISYIVLINNTLYYSLNRKNLKINLVLFCYKYFESS